MARFRSLFAALVPAACSFSSLGGLSGGTDEAGTPDGGRDASFVTGGAGGTGATGGATSSGGSSGTGGVSGSGGGPATGGTAGMPSDAGTDALLPGCDPTEVPGSGIYISPTGNDSTGDGSAGSPFASIARAMIQVSGGMPIFLDQGTYVDALTIGVTSGITLRGGWSRSGAAWTRDCRVSARESTVIQSSSNVGVRLEGDGATLALDTLTVRSKPVGEGLEEMSGESLYGIWVTGDSAQLTLNDVWVFAGPAGDGGAATRQVPATAPPACDGQSCADGSEGMMGPAGSGATAGMFGPTGYVPANGSDGTPGSTGENGTAPGAPGSGTCFAGCICTGPIGLCQPSGGAMARSGTPGRCGCGGRGGPAGGRGYGGGASVAVFASGAGAQVNADRSRLTASDGGDGSSGIAGDVGSAGLDGAGGTAVSCNICPVGICSAIACPTSTMLAGGTPGGPGGMGGPGGTGGGGAGGPTIAIVLSGGATSNLTDTVAEFGVPGTGAMGAPGGDARAELLIP